MSVILSVHGLVKNYGNIRAVDNVSFEVSQGEVCGILGPNGSGKTTTLSVIMGAVTPRYGSFRWNLPETKGGNAALQIGTLIEAPNFYPYLSLERNLRIQAIIKKVPEADIERVLNISGLYDRRHSRYQNLSLGMKQRLGIAAALLGDPAVLVLDEPANSLDPQGIADVRDIIRGEAEQGKTILMASHILDEVEKVCSHVVVLKKGKVIGSGSVDDLLARDDQIVVSCEKPEMLKKLLEQDKRVKKINQENGDLLLHVDETLDSGTLNELAFQQGIILTKIIRRQRTLESQFLELVKD
ncbi:MAG: ATP-binding cassette domain-containing protein [Chlorobi bacterium]|nr:ATP-binding cassette domain-containing protein [Chlorobiota bacterium]